MLNLTVEYERAQMDIAILGPITTIQTALPAMKGCKDAAILITAPASAIYPLSETASICIAAGATLNYTKILHRNLAEQGIYVGMVAVATFIIEPGQEILTAQNGWPVMTSREVAETPWQMYKERGDTVYRFVGNEEMVKQASLPIGVAA